jgi:hypothetical protein
MKRMERTIDWAMGLVAAALFFGLFLAIGHHLA